MRPVCNDDPAGSLSYRLLDLSFHAGKSSCFPTFTPSSFLCGTLAFCLEKSYSWWLVRAVACWVLFLFFGKSTPKTDRHLLDAPAGMHALMSATSGARAALDVEN